MKICIKYLLAISFLLNNSQDVKGQVLLSLLFGDNLNTGKVEFGLDGGVNFSALSNIPGSKSNMGFHLGFYFDIRLNEQAKIHTGIIVKSPLGADDIPKYSTGNSYLDNLLVNGRADRTLNYFNAPALLKYYFSHRIYAEGGIQLGLIYGASDTFTSDVYDTEDLIYEKENREQYHTLDAGFVLGAGWRILKGYGMNLGVRYYYGIIDVIKDDTGANVCNRSFYVALGIPIGVAKARERAEQKISN